MQRGTGGNGCQGEVSVHICFNIQERKSLEEEVQGEQLEAYILGYIMDLLFKVLRLVGWKLIDIMRYIYMYMCERFQVCFRVGIPLLEMFDDAS